MLSPKTKGGPQHDKAESENGSQVDAPIQLVDIEINSLGNPRYSINPEALKIIS
jgi:hypothetical protein